MPIVKTSILINAPADKIFDTMVDPDGIPKWASIATVLNIKGCIKRKQNNLLQG